MATDCTECNGTGRRLSSDRMHCLNIPCGECGGTGKRDVD